MGIRLRDFRKKKNDLDDASDLSLAVSGMPCPLGLETVQPRLCAQMPNAEIAPGASG